MADASRRVTLERLLHAYDEHDYETLRRLVTSDYVEEYPQTGERVRGIENVIATMEHYPGGLARGRTDLRSARLVGEDDAWVAGPSFGVVHVEGSGDSWSGVARIRYPDGTDWFVATFVEFRGDRIARNTEYFAPAELPAPEWRRAWVERIDGSDRA